MSTKTKLIIGLLFIVQIGVIVWSMLNKEASKTDFERRFELYLENPESIKILNFQAMELRELPDDILQFKNVETVNLSHNNFDDIPSILYGLPNLKRLDMSYNQLEDLSIQMFPNITHLDFNHNDIEYIEGQAFIETLKSIDLSYNQLHDFPYVRLDLDTLNLKYNELSNFTKIANELSNTIQHLDLSDNKFYNFDDAQLIAKHCYSLDLSNNRLAYNSNLPSTLFSEKFITQKLFFNNCGFDKIDVLPASQLEVLDLGNNNLNITDELVHQLKLKSLNLENQKLINFRHFNLNLKELNLVDVFYDGDLNAPNLEILHISNKNIANLPDFPNLKTIYFHMMDNDTIDEIVFQLKYPTADIQYRIINKTY